MDDSYSVRRMAFLSNLETYIIEILGEFIKPNFNTEKVIDDLNGFYNLVSFGYSIFLECEMYEKDSGLRLLFRRLSAAEIDLDEYYVTKLELEEILKLIGEMK